MPRRYFKHNEKVSALNFDHLKIIGEYRGRANVKGCYVYGLPEKSFDEPSLHLCITLTLESLTPPPEARKRVLKSPYSAGDPCSGLTSKNLKISGFFQQKEGQFAWIKGWPEGTSKFEPMQTYKVRFDTITKPQAQ
jgi:hypothetical protein